MKTATCLIIIALLFSCKKEKFEACPEYEKIIGEWESINGDIPIEVHFHSNGLIEEISDLERTNNIQAISCEFIFYSTLNKYQFNLKYRSLNYPIETNKYFDTLRIKTTAFNFSDSSLNQTNIFIRK